LGSKPPPCELWLDWAAAPSVVAKMLVWIIAATS
jgi:hypothetical protein